MKIKFRYLILALGVLFSFSSCKDEGLQPFIATPSANFWIHTLDHSFYGATTSEVELDTIVLKLAIVGHTTKHDRTVSGEAYTPEVIKDKPGQFRATPDQYKILGGVIPAGEIYGEFEVEVKNEDRLLTDEIKLDVKIIENEHFGLGLRENQIISLMWTGKIVRPLTWNAMRFFFTAVYSTQTYKVIIEAMNGEKEFYYYEGLVSPDEGYVMGQKFGNIVRAYKEKHGTPMLHDDGPNKGLPIEPIY